MVNATVIVSATFLVAGITVAALLVLKAQYDSKNGAYNTVAEICADLPFDDSETGAKVAVLCRDFDDVGLDDPIICGLSESEEQNEDYEITGDFEDYDGTYFTLRELLDADDIDAALDDTSTRCGVEIPNRKLSDVGSAASDGRELWDNYGWCSTSLKFVTGQSEDTANYCSDQTCSSGNPGCGKSLSSCCITHDMCLQSNGDAPRCSDTNCNGKSCDVGLCNCNRANVRCKTRKKCSKWWQWRCYSYDWDCYWASAQVETIMCPHWWQFGWTPQQNWNPNGQDCSRM